jgi:chromosome segregation ATPase
MSRSDEVYKPALEGKKVPVLTLDHKWHRLFTQIDTNPEIKSLETELNELLKRQGKINTETKEIKALKNKLMEEIRSSSMDAEALDEKKVEENKKLVEDCNEKLEAYQDEALDLPAKINEIKKKLMLATMEVCYDDIKEGTEEINEISQWIDEVRVELKKKVVRKQEKQKRIQDLYAFMHDIFGADVIEIFDMKYNPDENKLH